MASVRKVFTRTRPQDVAAPATDAVSKSAFINALLRNDIKATNVHEVRDGQGRLVRLEYDDPTGV